MTSEANWKHEEAARLDMITAGCLALGYIVGKDGMDALPVLMLAKALKGIGCEASHVDDIILAATKRVKVEHLPEETASICSAHREYNPNCQLCRVTAKDKL